MMLLRLILLVGIAATFVGCSAKGTYVGLQQNMENECSKSMSRSDYELCMERASVSYEEYERERQ